MLLEQRKKEKENERGDGNQPENRENSVAVVWSGLDFRTAGRRHKYGATPLCPAVPVHGAGSQVEIHE